jgi:hypothetical protein
VSAATLPDRHPASGDGVQAALAAVYDWSYSPQIEGLRALYANALERQWIALRDLDWEPPIDPEAFTREVQLGGVSIGDTAFWRALPLEVRFEIAREQASFLLSNFLHGEQGALMVAGQLVAAVPHTDAKFYAATQTLDEARHVEVFAAYLRKLGVIQPIAPGLKALLDSVLSTADWMRKAVGMQVVTEGLALYFFRDMRNRTSEPLLRQLLTYVARDEARHTAYGIRYLAAVVPTLAPRESQELQDFAFECTRALMASRAALGVRERVVEIFQRAGVDVADAFRRLTAERDLLAEQLRRTGGRYGPVSGFIVPTLRALGLYSERTASHFKEMWTASQGAEAAERYANSAAVLPDDLERWVEEGES